MRRLLTTAVLGFAMSTAALAAPTAVYDEQADAQAEIRAALAAARSSRQPVLVVFGANWCGDCKVLDMAFHSPSTAPLIAKNFKVVKVNVGRFDVNTDVASGYGVPLKSGIPAVAVLSPEGQVIYATRGGELADARKMGETGIYDFFTKVSSATR